MARSPETDPTSIGSLLLSRGLLTDEQLQAALAARADGELLGHAAARLGLVAREDVEALAEQQEVLRRAPPERTQAVCEAADEAVDLTRGVAKMLGGS